MFYPAVAGTPVLSSVESLCIYIFTSDEVDVSGVAISGFELKLQSFYLGEGTANFKFHGAFVVGREDI